MKYFIKLLIMFFLFIIFYDLVFYKIREGLTQTEIAKETSKKIKSIETDIAKLQKVDPLAPCTSINKVVKDNTDSIKTMKDQVADVKANCSRQTSVS